LWHISKWKKNLPKDFESVLDGLHRQPNLYFLSDIFFDEIQNAVGAPLIFPAE